MARAKKTYRPDKFFRKPIPRKKFEKRCLGRMAHADDRAFLSSLFSLQDGAYRFTGTLDKAGAKRLKGLAKAIKADVGFLNPAPVVMLGILAGAFAVFIAFFMNPLLERAAEAGLSSAFQAKAEIAGFRLNIFGMGVSMRSLAIADRDAPMTNLVESGPIRLKLDPAAAFRLRVRIEEARADRLAFGTPRKESGALPEYPPREKAKDAAAETPPMVDLSAFDAKALLEREKDKLASMKAYAEAKDAYARIETEWKDRVESSKKGVDDLKASSERLRNLDPKKVKTIDEARKAIADIQALKASASGVTDAAKGAAGGLKKDMDAALALEKAAVAAMDKDRAYLRSLVDPRSGAAFGALEPTLRAMLSDSSEKYLNYGLRALEVLDGLKAKGAAAKAGGGKAGGKKAATEKRKKAGGPKGRDYPFPVGGYPAFWLVKLDSSFNDGSRDWVLSLADVSTEPDLVNAPSRLLLNVKGSGFGAEAKASADFRSASGGAYLVEAAGNGLPVDLKEGLSSIGLDGFSGSGGGTLRAEGRAAGGIDLRADLSVTKASVSGARGAIGSAVAEGVRKLGVVEAGIEYRKAAGGDDAFKLRTNLDKIAAEAAAAAAGTYAKKALADLDAAFKDYGGGAIAETLGAKGGAEGLLKSALSGEKGANDIQKTLDEKTKQLEARIKELGAGALKGLKLPGI